ncbi:hypothetical protein [Gracilibacillus sp. Marseille-QA3620]
MDRAAGNHHVSNRELLLYLARNFCIAFWVEALIAQPIARQAMKKLHKRQDRKAQVISS